MIYFEELNAHNWLEICKLSVSEEQKKIFSVLNVYWIGISRYEEKSTLFAIKSEHLFVGLIGLGYDEDGVSGFINPLMIDERYQGKGYSSEAMKLAIEYLKVQLNVSVIHHGHRKHNRIAAHLYEKFGFVIYGEDENDYFRELVINRQ